MCEQIVHRFLDSCSRGISVHHQIAGVSEFWAEPLAACSSLHSSSSGVSVIRSGLFVPIRRPRSPGASVWRDSISPKLVICDSLPGVVLSLTPKPGRFCKKWCLVSRMPSPVRGLMDFSPCLPLTRCGILMLKMYLCLLRNPRILAWSSNILASISLAWASKPSSGVGLVNCVLPYISTSASA